MKIETKEVDSMMKIIKEIKKQGRNPKHVFSNAMNHYIIEEKDKPIAYIEQPKGYNWGRAIEDALGLGEKCFFVRFIPSNSPAFYALDGFKMPYEIIKTLITNENVKTVKWDKDYKDGIHKGLYLIESNLLMVLKGEILHKRMQKAKKLSVIDYRNVSFKKFNETDALIQFGKDAVYGALVISDLQIIYP